MTAVTLARAGVIVVEGNYQNRNIYVQNSYAGAGVGFCVYQVAINGEVAYDEVNSSAFEIDLANREFKLGQSVVIEIIHKDDGCAPKILNPEVLKPNPTFKTVDIQINERGVLMWETTDETAELDFVIEQFKWNKWVQVGHVKGKGTPTTNMYSFQTTALAGTNKFRVKQKGYIDKVRYTPTVSYVASRKEVTYIYNRKKQKVEFSEDTGFEVYDKYGNLVKKGFSRMIDLSNLERDIYYLNFGNSSTEFRVK